ncbi:WD repeat-containing protein 91-like [Clytia hemisphaerica]|uniref:WD repeat-containing protein 91 n=1 Tax=Clytia hemisphaerica TaxID=252671 RepID=A0A7M5V977_9CNID
MATTANALDDLIKEYLIYRGFTATLKCFDVDLKNDKSKSFKVENILEQFATCIHNTDITSLRKYWKYFDRCFFSQLGHDTYKVIKKLEGNLLKLYIIHCVQTNKMDKVTEFFEKYASELHHEDNWKEWFALPFMKNPEQARSFSICFTKIWQDSVLLSLGNCLETVFNNISLPTLLNFEKEKSKFEKLEEENVKLLGRLASYEKEIIQYHARVTAEKTDAACQTIDISIEMNHQERLKKSKSIEPSTTNTKPKFGWKIFAGNKDSVKTPKKENNKPDGKLDEKQLFRSSLDESALRRLKQLTKQNSTNKIKKTNSEDNGVINKQLNDDISLSSTEGDEENVVDVTVPSADFYVPLDNNKDVTSDSLTLARSNSKQETPFIVLSQDEFTEHNASIISCRFSDNNNIVASLDVSGIVKIWQCYPAISAQSMVTLKGDYTSLDWVPKLDGKLVLGKGNSVLSLYDVNQKKMLWETNINSKFKRVNCITSSPVSATAAVSLASDSKKNNSNQQQKLIKMKQYPFHTPKSSREGCLCLWDLHTGQKKTDLTLDPNPVCIHSLAYNHNGTLLVSGGADGMIRLYDIRNNDCLIGWHGHSTNVLDVKFNPDETCIYSIDASGKLAVWDINKVSSKIAEFPLPAGSTGIYDYSNTGDEIPSSHLLACDSEGNHMMTCSPSGLMLYQVKPIDSMEEVMHLVSRCSEVLTLDWTSSPNCSTAICGTRKGTVQISTLLKR